MIVLMLIISMSAQILIPHITANADDSTGAEGRLFDGSLSSGATGGPNLRWDRCGWLAYVVTLGGHRVSDCAILCPTVGGSSNARREFPIIVGQAMTGVPGAYSQALIPRGETSPVTSAPIIPVTGLRVPYTSGGTGSGAAMKTWLNLNAGDPSHPDRRNGGFIMAILASRGCISSSLAADINANKQNYCLVLEAVGASSVYRAPYGMPWTSSALRGSDDQYAKAVATAYGMAYYATTVAEYPSNGVVDRGGSALCWNKCLPLCAFPGPSWPEFNLYHPSDLGGPTTGYLWTDTIMNKGSYGIVAWRTDGGVPTTGTGIDTYDIPNQPSVPSYCEYPTPGLKSGPCKIVKHYWEGTDDGSGVMTYTEYGTYTRDLCSNMIHITDEKDKVGYELVGWWSTHNYNASLDNPTPMAAVDSRRTSAGYQQGTGETTVTLNANAGENTLVLVFVKTGTVTLAVDGDYRIWQSQIAQRASFDSVDALRTALANHSFKWRRTWHYTSCHAHGGHGHTLNCSSSHHSSSCPTGCTTNHGHNNNCYTNPCTGWHWVDNTVKLGVKNVNSSSYPSVLSHGHQEVHRDGKHTDYIKQNSDYWLKTFNTSNGVITGTNDLYMSNHQYDFVIFRGQDRLTLAEWRNTTLSQGSTIKDFLTHISSGSYNFVSANTKGTRKDNSYVDQFTAKFGDNSSDRSTTYGPSWHGCSNETLSFGLQNVKDGLTAKVAVDVYWANGVPVDYPCPPNEVAQNEVDRALEAGSIEYLPYIMMRYDGDNYDDRRVAVLSQFKRTATFYDYIEYEIDEPYNAFLSIDIMSNQWSTHRQAATGIQNFFGADKTGDYIVNGFASQSILPGGAVFSFGIPSDHVRTVTVKSMQAYLPTGSSGYDQVTATGTNNGLETDTDTIKANHKDFVDNARAEFEKALIREYLATNRSLSSSATNSWDIVQSGKELFPNISIPVLKTESSTMNNTTNGDTKYYFNNYAESKLDTCYAVESGGSNLSDASYEASTRRHTYTFYTNTLGEIRCILDDTNVNEAVVASQKGWLVCNPGSMSIVDSFRSSSPTGYDIAASTDVVYALKASIVSQAGTDPDCPWGREWYNEAFDGITYMYQETDFKVGIWNPVTRETVLDTAVTPYQESKDDFFTLFHAMALNSWKEDDKFGEFTNSAGNSYTLTYDFDGLYGSKIFYIPNVTTQDLN